MKFINYVLPLCLLLSSCIKTSGDEIELKNYPVDDIEEIITPSGIEIDKQITADGNGSLKIISDAPDVIQLYETGDLDVEDATITYRAKVKTENVQGQVYLEMWCVFDELGEYFSRGLDQSLAGSNNWQTLETSFFLRAGENPDNIKLNLSIAGTGTVWIDDIRLVKK